jgi:hypothetical protein
LFCFTVSGQSKAVTDSTIRKQGSKNTTHANSSANPINNEISVDDPGMPAQKSTTRSKGISRKPIDEKK